MQGLDLKIKRMRRGLRQYEVAAAVGIAPCRLSEIETGRREATPELVQRIVEAIKEGKSGNNG